MGDKDGSVKLSISIDGIPYVVTGLKEVSAANDKVAESARYVDTHLGRFAVTADKTREATGRMADTTSSASGRMVSDLGAVEPAVGRVTADFGDMRGMIQGVVAAWGSWELLKTAKEATMFAANVEQADRALSVIANNMGRTSGEAVKYRDSMRDLGITTNSATNATAQFLRNNLPLEKLNTMARAAQGAAISYNMMTGEMISSSQALDKWVRAIVTGNVTELHTLGINVMMRDILRENKLATGESTMAVDSHRRHMMMLNESLEKADPLLNLYTNSMDLASKKITSSKRPLEELKLALGQLFLPELTAGATIFYDTVPEG